MHRVRFCTVTYDNISMLVLYLYTNFTSIKSSSIIRNLLMSTKIINERTKLCSHVYVSVKLLPNPFMIQDWYIYELTKTVAATHETGLGLNHTASQH